MANLKRRRGKKRRLKRIKRREMNLCRGDPIHVLKSDLSLGSFLRQTFRRLKGKGIYTHALPIFSSDL